MKKLCPLLYQLHFKCSLGTYAILVVQNKVLITAEVLLDSMGCSPLRMTSYSLSSSHNKMSIGGRSASICQGEFRCEELWALPVSALMYVRWHCWCHRVRNRDCWSDDQGRTRQREQNPGPWGLGMDHELNSRPPLLPLCPSANGRFQMASEPVPLVSRALPLKNFKSLGQGSTLPALLRAEVKGTHGYPYHPTCLAF
jgi:hypothetical protein